MAGMLERFADTLAPLSFCNPVTVSAESGHERGCAIITISDKCDAILYLEGLIETDKEKARVATRVESVQQQLVKLRNAMTVANYSDKVPATVQTANKDKETQLEAELVQLAAAFSTLSTMA